MGKATLNINQELQQLYWNFIEQRAKEYLKQGLTGRLVIDFQKGLINSIQDQMIVSGATVLLYSLDKIDKA